MQHGKTNARVGMAHGGKPASAGNLTPRLRLVAGEQRRPKVRAMATLVRTGRHQVMRLGQAELGDVLGALVKAPGATSRLKKYLPRIQPSSPTPGKLTGASHIT